MEPQTRSYDDEWNEYEKDFYDSDPAWNDEEWDDEEWDEDWDEEQVLLDDASDPADELIAADPEAFKLFAEDFNAENGGN